MSICHVSATETTLLHSETARKTIFDDFEYILGRRTAMTAECPDEKCKLKIQAVDHAIGHYKNEWSVLLNSTTNNKDVELALRFCELFRLESKVKIETDGYVVLVKNDLVRPL